MLMLISVVQFFLTLLIIFTSLPSDFTINNNIKVI